MERQRVVHYARSRTAKVIRPVFTNYPAASQATDSAELSQAPLASMDSDFVIITKRRDETNMAPNLWSQINTNMPQTHFILQNMGEHSGIFDTDDNFGEQKNYSLPRTYVKLRASQHPNVNTAWEKSQFPGPQCGPRGQFANNSHKSHHVTANCNRQFPTHVYNTQSTYYTKSTSRSEMTYRSNDSYVEQLISGRDSHASGGFSNKLNGYSHESTKYLVESATIKENAPVDSRIKPGEHSQVSPIATINSDHSSLNPQTFFSSSLEPGHNVAETSSRIDSFSDRNFINVDVSSTISSQGFPSADRVRINECRRSGLSDGNHQRHRTESFEMSKAVNQSSAGGTDTVLAADCRVGSQEMLPDVCGISPSEYTSDIRLASERISQMYTRHLPQAGPSPRYSSIYVSGSPRPSVNNPNIDVQNERDRSCFESQLVGDTRFVNTVNQNSRFHGITNVDQRKTPHTAQPNNVLHPENSPCWKRSSLRQATHGYMSISELTVSMEDLDIKPSEMHTSTNTSYFNVGLERSNRTHSVNVVDNTCSHDQQTGKFGEKTVCVNCDTSSREDSSCTGLLDMNTTQSPNDGVRLSGSKRMSYQLATSDSASELLNDKGRCELTNTGNNRRVHIHKSNSLSADTGNRYIKVEHLAGTRSGNVSGRHRDTEGSDNRQQVSLLETYDHEEELRSLKRRSFKLATSSLSDLTFLDDSVESEFSAGRQNVRTVGHLGSKGVSGESVDSIVFCTPDVHRQRIRGDSFSSGRLNSSFGSFYSCQSRDLQFSVDASNKHPQLQHGQHQKHSLPALERLVSRDTVGSDSSFSADSSAYYTGSDNSYPTPDGDSSAYYTASDISYPTVDADSGTTPYVDLRQPPSRMTMPAQRQKSSTNRHRKMTPSKTSLNNVSFKANTLPQNVKKPPKYYSQAGVLRCYACGVNDKLSIPAPHRGRKPSARLESSRNRIWVNPDYIHGRQLDLRKRSRSAPAPRCAPTRQTEASIRKLMPVKAQMYAEPGLPAGDVSFSLSVSSPGSSVTTFTEPPWHVMPRIPPSLGRPRRKLYAGFDSQPLPMDNFLSDSSSVYSTQSCSSWGTSRSATVESCSRTPDLLSKARSTSSIASSLITPTRPVNHDDVFDFFTYTDKRSSVYENNHNLYLSRENSYPEDCYKEAFYDMTYSKESLESFLSDGTTVNADHDFSPENSLGYEQNRLNSFSGSANLQNNNRAVADDLKQDKQKNQLDIEHNRCQTEIKQTASLQNTKNQLTTLKGSAPEVHGKPKFLSKRKYFSTKDIFDLVMTSDKNYKDTKGRSRSLERQAQKVCESILCLT